MSFAKITGTGVFIPEKILSNKDLESLVDTSDEWIKTRTGISERRILEDGRTTSDMCVDACKEALKNAKVSPQEIDGIIVAGSHDPGQFGGTLHRLGTLQFNHESP